jgi:hypothetical protein
VAEVHGRASLALRAWLASGTLATPANDQDAAATAAAAQAHRLGPLLYLAASSHGRGWPEDVLRELHDTYQRGFVGGSQRLDVAQQVLELMDRAALRALPLKGVTVAERLYASVAERPMVDVDILTLDDWPASVAVLEAAGFRVIDRADHAWVFTEPVQHVTVELHHSITSCPGLFPVDREGLWARRRRGPGHVKPAPSAEDLLVQLALHTAFQHGLVSSLGQYLDFRRLLEREPPDTDRVLAIAASARAEPPLAAALEAAASTVAAPVPERLRSELRRRTSRGFQTWLARRLREPPGLLVSPRPSLSRARWALAPGRRLAFVLGTLAPTSPASEGPPWRQPWRVLARIASLARRWGPDAVRGLLGRR